MHNLPGAWGFGRSKSLPTLVEKAVFYAGTIFRSSHWSSQTALTIDFKYPSVSTRRRQLTLASFFGSFNSTKCSQFLFLN